MPTGLSSVEAHSAAQFKEKNQVQNPSSTRKINTSPTNQHENVSAFSYRLLNLELVRHFGERGDQGELERIGFVIGKKFSERFVRFHPRYVSTLETIKFVCKELWVVLFGKHVNKLQTNHKGIYVMHDNNFFWISEVDLDHENSFEVNETKKLLMIPCGIIRGALATLGIRSVVRAEFSTLPSCTFNVQILEEILASATTK